MAKKKKTQLPQTTINPDVISLPSSGRVKIHSEHAIKMIFDHPNVDKKDLPLATELINNIAPRNSIEAMVASQAVASHLSGMRTMNERFINSSLHGMKLLALSQQAFHLLNQYRVKNIPICTDEH